MKSHLAYRPLVPCANKYLQYKWDKASYDFHRERVKSAKSAINTTPPKTYIHLALGLKKEKLVEELTVKTQRENTILWDKISHIMRTSGGVNNRNHYNKKSLSQERRQLELLRITKENQIMLLHLRQCRPHYNVRSWQKDWRKTLKVMDSIALYPRGLTSQQKGKEKPIKKCSSDKHQNISADATTHSPPSNDATGKSKSEENEKRKEACEDDGPKTEIQPDIAAPETDPADNPPQNAETSPSPDGSEMSNTHEKPEQETASPAEG